MNRQPCVSSASRFLHVVPDDKFIDAAIVAFEDAAPGCHEFVHLAQPDAFRYIQSGAVRTMGLGEATSPGFIDRLAGYSAVFIHYLDNRARLLMANSRRETRFVWLGWGGDYYHLFTGPEELQLPRTRELLAHLAGEPLTRAERFAVSQAVPSDIPDFDESVAALRIRVQRSQIGPRGSDEHLVLNKFSGFAPVLPQEFARVVAAVPGFSPAQVRWNYPLGGDTYDRPGVPGCVGDGILVGNSATASNNHLETLAEISRAWDGVRTIYCPLSYGDDRYADAVAAEGARLFGEKFVALRGFLPLDDYMAVLRQCSVAVMGHIRQQGLGNVLLMLGLGARVFVREENPIHAFLAGEGMAIHGLQAWPHLAGSDRPDEAEIAANRATIVRLFGEAAHRRATVDLLKRYADLPQQGQ